MQKEKISFIIRTLNEIDYLPELVRIIRRDVKHFELIIVDSGSSDGTVEYCRGEEDIKLVEISKRDFTFGRAINIGLAEITGVYTIVMSAHCIPIGNNWHEELIKPLRKSKVAASFGRQVAWPKTNFLERLEYYECYGEESTSVTLSNAFACYVSELLKSNLFNEVVRANEDDLWFKSISIKGYDVSYVPASCVYHSHDEGLRDSYCRYERERVIYGRAEEVYRASEDLRWLFTALYRRLFVPKYSNLYGSLFNDLKFLLYRLIVISKMKLNYGIRK